MEEDQQQEDPFSPEIEMNGNNNKLRKKTQHFKKERKKWNTNVFQCIGCIEQTQKKNETLIFKLLRLESWT